MAPKIQTTANSVESFLALAKEHKEKRIIALFCGSSDSESGESWCPDCVKGMYELISQSHPYIYDSSLSYSIIVFLISLPITRNLTMCLRLPPLVLVMKWANVSFCKGKHRCVKLM